MIGMEPMLESCWSENGIDYEYKEFGFAGLDPSLC